MVRSRQTTRVTWPALGFVYLGVGILIATLALGCLAMFHFAFASPGSRFTFQHSRPLHVSLAVAWIFGTVIGLVYAVLPSATGRPLFSKRLAGFHLAWFVFFGLAIVVALASGSFGGREYWAFPPIFAIAILVSWLLFAINFFGTVRRGKGPYPVYVWMWMTGILGFFFTYGESLLWMIPHFSGNPIREATVQWKSYGSMVGSWNMLIYGTQFYIMKQIEGEQASGFSKKAFFFYFLSLTNMMFNWGHHTYPVPGSVWIDHVAYVISLTELAFFVKIIADWSKRLDAARKHRHNTSYRFFVAAEWWGYLNLALALLISIPAINWMTHGTHITVAHAMGSTIGINTMILIGAVSYVLHGGAGQEHLGWQVSKGFWLTQVSLLAFFLSLVGAGVYNAVHEQSEVQHTMILFQLKPVFGAALVAGLGIAAGMFLVLAKLVWTHARHPIPQTEPV
ncbi:Cbb3-type cytochrome c oxidase subunit I [Sulfidibacter corallicola]|uniref:Cbb3-type cytochrome c oxidase subunit I n=1 Tax=Sulfidibacter corallicola TaxID=2818388 RepID=A0A8A4TSB3_SULCO|nr:cbb3-type cytochrome c oxidase subunit I [Sulfidibacter corallicola]QTD52277.1 cbb3-type cytochrome c oxidase subunit I [Sulfidibacter corallicola]